MKSCAALLRFASPKAVVVPALPGDQRAELARVDGAGLAARSRRRACSSSPVPRVSVRNCLAEAEQAAGRALETQCAEPSSRYFMSISAPRRWPEHLDHGPSCSCGDLDLDLLDGSSISPSSLER